MHRNGKLDQNAAVAAPATPAAVLPTTVILDASGAALDATPKPRRRLGALGAGASITERLASAQVAIEMVLGDPQLQAIVAAYGYDAARMREGQALRERALALYQQQRAGFGQRLSATDARTSAQSEAHSAYMRHVAVARVALRGERGAAQALDVAAPRQRRQAGWLLQAQQFYANALGTPIAQKLAAFGVTRDQLAEAQRLVEAVAATTATQQAAKDAAQALTKERDAALDALDRWMRDFRAIAHVALAD